MDDTHHELLMFLVLGFVFAALTAFFLNMQPVSDDISIADMRMDDSSLVIEAVNDMGENRYVSVRPRMKTSLFSEVMVPESTLAPDSPSLLEYPVTGLPMEGGSLELTIWLEHEDERTEKHDVVISREDDGSYQLERPSPVLDYMLLASLPILVVLLILYIRSELHVRLKRKVEDDVMPSLKDSLDKARKKEKGPTSASSSPSTGTSAPTSGSADDGQAKDEPLADKESMFDKKEERPPASSSPAPLEDKKDDIEKSISENISEVPADKQEKIDELKKLLDDGIIDKDFFERKKKLILGS